MKRLLILLLAFIYLTEVSGMSFYQHYCMDRLVSWGLTKGGSNCPSCGMDKALSGKRFCNGCCKDELKTVKITSDHKAETFSWKASLLSAIVPSFSLTNFSILVSEPDSPWNTIHAPPFKQKVPAYLFNRVFRI